jgi:hypothetical protein
MATLNNASIELMPAKNSANNNQIYDVVGNKTDDAHTAVETTRSVMGVTKGILTQANLIKAKTDTLDMTVPAADATTNTISRDVIGNKTDAAVVAVGTTKSLMGYIKGILTNLNLTKADAAQAVSDTADILTQLTKIDTAPILSTLGNPQPGSLGHHTIAIDDRAVNGLLGVEDSLAYKVHEIERHFHGWERHLGVAYAPSGTHKADRIGSTVDAPFALTSGNNNWGAWVQILGSADTPITPAMAKYDLHEIITVANNNASPYFFQVGYGASGAASLTAGTYSSKVLSFPAVNDKARFLMMCDRQAAGELAWARIMVPGQNAKTMSFYIGLHEYEG